VRAVADAKQTFAAPSPQPIDLHGEQFDFRSIVHPPWFDLWGTVRVQRCRDATRAGRVVWVSIL